MYCEPPLSSGKSVAPETTGRIRGLMSAAAVRLATAARTKGNMVSVAFRAKKRLSSSVFMFLTSKTPAMRTVMLKGLGSSSVLLMLHSSVTKLISGFSFA